jgi:outer membrane protein TolC
VSAFANLSYIGNVPDNRSMTISDPNDPFSFTASGRGFFSSSYWNPAVNAGLRLSWNLFSGNQTSARMQQRQVAIRKAELDAEFQLETVRQEVQAALRNLDAARTRILSQEQNVERAELNYEYAVSRLREGVASPLEERNASEQLDLSRLNYLQAVHDYLSAQSAFQTAVGIPHSKGDDSRMTLNQ